MYVCVTWVYIDDLLLCYLTHFIDVCRRVISSNKVFLSSPGQDCQVGDWQEWSTCDNQCGYGARKRTRKVIVYPDNGGHHCPIMKQRRACVGFDQNICDQNRLGEQAEEKAGEPIYPAKWTTSPKYHVTAHKYHVTPHKYKATPHKYKVTPHK